MTLMAAKVGPPQLAMAHLCPLHWALRGQDINGLDRRWAAQKQVGNSSISMKNNMLTCFTKTKLKTTLRVNFTKRGSDAQII